MQSCVVKTNNNSLLYKTLWIYIYIKQINYKTIVLLFQKSDFKVFFLFLFFLY